MSESPMFSTMVLPPDLVADDVIGLRDQMSARVAAVLRPRGGKRREADAPLPKGLEPLAALPPHIDRQAPSKSPRQEARSRPGAPARGGRHAVNPSG
ncbi:hypothetical protein [Sorangium sp. So ce341]|uniref:hypothetical protein n=1 Tax=Sorangium sp. So ce341 TaxID=3133302 RepID=UPI003F5FD9BB